MDGAFSIPSGLPPQGSVHKPKAIDLSHHLNSIAIHRAPNQLKELYRYMGIPGMASHQMTKLRLDHHGWRHTIA